jgi:hypothetical protein
MQVKVSIAKIRLGRLGQVQNFIAEIRVHSLGQMR